VNGYLPAAAKIVDEESWGRWAEPARKERAAYVLQARQQQEGKRAALAQYLADRRTETAAGTAANLAAFKPVSASDVSPNGPSPHGLGFCPEYANDANDETYWAADFAPQWVVVDLRQPEAIGRLVVRNYFRDNRFYRYEVQLSSDRRTWRTVASKDNDTPATAAGDTYRFAPQTARYIRVMMLQNSANVGLHVVEVEAYR
jgi:NedA-like, galactose-binding domain